jgi:hypothetical protein
MSQVNGVHFGQHQAVSGPGRLVQTENGQLAFVPVSLEQTPEQFENSQAKPKKAFSYLNATGRFLQGAVLDTVDNVFSVKGLIGIGLSAAAVAAFGTPALVGLGAVGALCGAAGIIGGIKRSKELYAEGKVKESENAFRGVGSGFSSLALSVAGLRTTTKAYFDGGKAKVVNLGEKSKTLSQHFFSRLSGIGKSFIGKDGQTIQIPKFDGNKILQKSLWGAAKGVGHLAQNGTIASGAALTNVNAQSEMAILKDKMDCIN